MAGRAGQIRRVTAGVPQCRQTGRSLEVCILHAWSVLVIQKKCSLDTCGYLAECSTNWRRTRWTNLVSTMHPTTIGFCPCSMLKLQQVWQWEINGDFSLKICLLHCFLQEMINIWKNSKNSKDWLTFTMLTIQSKDTQVTLNFSSLKNQRTLF